VGIEGAIAGIERSWTIEHNRTATEALSVTLPRNSLARSLAILAHVSELTDRAIGNGECELLRGIGEIEHQRLHVDEIRRGIAAQICKQARE